MQDPFSHVPFEPLMNRIFGYSRIILRPVMNNIWIETILIFRCRTQKTQKVIFN